jgi:hypothetical protein
MRSSNSGSTPFPWAFLEVGQEVELLERGSRHFAGVVDALTDDLDMIWITSSTGERRLFHVADGYTPSLTSVSEHTP